MLTHNIHAIIFFPPSLSFFGVIMSLLNSDSVFKTQVNIFNNFDFILYF